MISIKEESSYGDKIKKTTEEGNEVYSFEYPCSNYSSCSPIEITFSAGFYFLECFGASGTFVTYNSLVGKGGSGGYSSGVFIAKRKTRLFLYIGASKNLTQGAETLKETFNGSPGGNNGLDAPGGGATDFRRKNGAWKENPSSRIIVAGGGGSGRIHTNYGSYAHKGGNGGGSEGEAGEGLNCSSPFGTQNESKINECKTVEYGHGTFGSGAGGGWAGGGGGLWGGGWVKQGAGGGGSGYIGGVVSIGKYKAITKQTNDVFGSGRARITVLSNFPRSLICRSIMPRKIVHIEVLAIVTFIVY